MNSYFQLNQKRTNNLALIKWGVKSVWILIILLALNIPELEAQSNLNSNGQVHRIDYSGNYVDYTIPASYGARDEIKFYLEGADGGKRRVPSLCVTKGGSGAKVTLTFQIGTGLDEVQPGGIIRFVVGKRGESKTGNNISAGGGGGGTAVLYQHPGSSSNCNGDLYNGVGSSNYSGCWHLLAVAGAGGGAYSSGTCGGQNGRGGEAGESGSRGFGTWGGVGGYGGGVGGESDEAGAGGGALAGSSYTWGGGRGWHSGGSGGQGSNRRDGGWGYGGGGTAGWAGGGGGGYSGGGAGALYSAGGGGGSFANSDALWSHKNDGGATGNPKHGYITYQFQDKDPQAPFAVCKDITMQLGQHDQVTLIPSDINAFITVPLWQYEICNADGSRCRLLKTITCSDVGRNQKILKVSNMYGSDECIANIEVIENEVPTPVCVSAFVRLNSSGNASLAASTIGGNSYDNCGISELILNKSEFNCFDFGSNTITLTAIDESENSSSCTVNISVLDEVPPIAICKSATLSLDIKGQLTLNRLDIDNGSNDNCHLSTFILSKSQFTCADLGAHSIVMTVKDQSNNSARCTTQVTIVDHTGPLAFCQDVTVQLDVNGAGTLSPTDVDNGSYDACTGSNIQFSLTKTQVDCNDIGTQVVQALTTDANGYTSTCQSQITVQDTIAPVAMCQPATIYLDSNGEGHLASSQLDNGSVDNCQIASYGMSRSQFNCSRVGIQLILLTVYDQQNNFTKCATTLTIRDTVPPQLICQPATINLGLDGKASLNYSDFVLVENDACGISGRTILTNENINCENAGRNDLLVTLKTTDLYGNQSQCTAFATVIDDLPPAAICQPTTVYLDNSGTAQLISSQMDNGSYDNCEIGSYALSKQFFDCVDLGQQVVTLTVTDAHNNSSSCTATVDTKDEATPIIHVLGDPVAHICQGETYVDAGTAVDDNCSLGTAIGNVGIVNTATVGTYFITYSYTDPNGNAAIPVSRTVIVDPTPGQLAETSCNGCQEIRFTICQYDVLSDLQTYVESNSNFENGAFLNWYLDNNGSIGSQINNAPFIDPATTGSRYFWVEQQLGDCPGEAIKVRAKVKKLYTPDFTLPAIGCGGSAQIDLAAWVSDPKNKAKVYTFYDVNPESNPSANAIGSVHATKGVVDAGQYLIVNIIHGNQTYWVQSTVPNRCGGIASSTLSAPTQSASLSPLNNLAVTSGDAVNIAFNGQHTTNIMWFDLATFANPNIGIMGTMGMGNLAFTAYNTGSSPQTSTIRVIPYNGNCAGAPVDFTITVNPGTQNRQTQNSLKLAASKINSHDVSFNWNITYAFELLRFEVEKKRNKGEFESIAEVAWNGNGAYQFTDRSGMGNSNQYRLKLVLTDGRIVWSDVVEVNMDFVDNRRFALFPNPVSDQFSVKALFPMTGRYQWQLSDVMGKVVKTGTMDSQEIQIQADQFAAGIYHLVMISPEGKRYIIKMMKIKN